MAKTTIFITVSLMLFSVILTAKAASLESTNEPDIVNVGGDYLVKFSLGTPQVPAFGTFSTRDDLTWIQCSTCASCSQLRLPFFDYTKSSTYKRASCSEPSCKLFPQANCSKPAGGDNQCLFSDKFGVEWFAEGEIATDTVTLGPNLSGPGFSFGCGIKNGDITGSGRSGILGFGRGKGSIVNQLNSIVQGKFSYCLVPDSSTVNSSKLHLGSNALVSGPGVVSTPLVLKSPDTFYYLTLEGISVGDQKIKVDDQQAANSEGNMIIETGTRKTSLPQDLYDRFLTAVKASIKLPEADNKPFYDLCYTTKEEIPSPGFTAHFKGADVKLNVDNLFVRLKQSGDHIACLAIKSAGNNSPGVYGSLAQTNFRVGIDLQKNVVSFKAVDCSKGQ